MRSTLCGVVAPAPMRPRDLSFSLSLSLSIPYLAQWAACCCVRTCVICRPHLLASTGRALSTRPKVVASTQTHTHARARECGSVPCKSARPCKRRRMQKEKKGERKKLWSSWSRAPFSPHVPPPTPSRPGRACRRRALPVLVRSLFFSFKILSRSGFPSVGSPWRAADTAPDLRGGLRKADKESHRKEPKNRGKKQTATEKKDKARPRQTKRPRATEICVLMFGKEKKRKKRRGTVSPSRVRPTVTARSGGRRHPDGAHPTPI